MKSRLTDILFVLIVAVLIAMFIAVARSAWSGLRRRLLSMRSIANPLNHGNRLLVRRLLCLLLLRLPPDPLRNPLRHPLHNQLSATDLQSQVDSLTLTFQSLSDSINSRLTEFVTNSQSYPVVQSAPARA